MAHECPDCWQTCYCGGDIDDILLNMDRYVNQCTHCPEDRGYPDDDYRDDE